MTMRDNDYVIDVKNLNKSFDGKPAVINVALQLRRGEIFGFLGPNGSGKTTTIRMLCGLLIPDSGEGQCLGYDILTQSLSIKEHVGYMTQKFSLYEDLTVRENLDFIARLYQMHPREQYVENTLKEFEMTARKDQLAGTLSGGWKQRLALAAAMLHKPSLLLLDEPTAGVDPKARRDFWDQIHHLSRQGITTLVSTHYMDEAERCHRLAYIAYGHLMTQGTIREIISETKLVTWEVTGKDLETLSDQLKVVKGIEQVTPYGNTLHVSGRDRALILDNIKPYLNNPHYQWHEIRPGLEDVFINLSVAAQETRYV